MAREWWFWDRLRALRVKGFGVSPAYEWEDAYREGERYWRDRSFDLTRTVRRLEKGHAQLLAELAALVAAVDDLKSALDTARRGD